MSDKKKVQNHDEMIPLRFHLSQNYPNPFHGKTTIKYCVPYRTEITISIYDLHGTLAKKLLKETKNPGTYEVGFEARHWPAGTYYCRLQAGEYSEEKRMDKK